MKKTNSTTKLKFGEKKPPLKIETELTKKKSNLDSIQSPKEIDKFFQINEIDAIPARKMMSMRC